MLNFIKSLNLKQNNNNINIANETNYTFDSLTSLVLPIEKPRFSQVELAYFNLNIKNIVSVVTFYKVLFNAIISEVVKCQRIVYGFMPFSLPSNIPEQCMVELYQVFFVLLFIYLTFFIIFYSLNIKKYYCDYFNNNYCFILRLYPTPFSWVNTIALIIIIFYILTSPIFLNFVTVSGLNYTCSLKFLYLSLLLSLFFLYKGLIFFKNKSNNLASLTTKKKLFLLLYYSFISIMLMLFCWLFILYLNIRIASLNFNYYTVNGEVLTFHNILFIQEVPFTNSKLLFKQYISPTQIDILIDVIHQHLDSLFKNKGNYWSRYQNQAAFEVKYAFMNQNVEHVNWRVNKFIKWYEIQYNYENLYRVAVERVFSRWKAHFWALLKYLHLV
jgi:hypothetical protein